MFRNYFITAVRNLLKKFSFTVLNVAGLAIGITCAALIFLWVRDELTFDDYFENKESLYKVKNKQTYDGKTFTFDATPGPFGPAIAAEIPGIKYTCRSSSAQNLPVHLGDKSFSERGLYVDSTFFSMFNLEFVQGSASAAFKNINSVVLTEELANKFFPPGAAVGKQLYMDANEPVMVSGVVKTLPENTSLRFSWLAPFDVFMNANPWAQSWGNNGVATFVQTEKSANVAQINAQLKEYILTKGENYISRFSIYPMSRWHLYDNFENGVEKEGAMKFVRLFTIIAWVILLIACINFMNLSTARSEQRAREVGVRKVLGAGREKLILQFLTESMLLAVLATLLAVGCVILLLPAFNNLVQKNLSLQLHDFGTWGALAAIALICGVVAGSYPAFYLSSFQPVKVLKGLRLGGRGSNQFVRKGLVVFQFTISIILIIGTFIIYGQINYVKQRDLGYRKDRLLAVQIQGDMMKNYNAIRQTLLTGGFYENVGLSRNSPLQYSSNTGDFSWQGKDPQTQILVTIEPVNSTYIPTVGYEVTRGRNFYDNSGVDSNRVIINETLASFIKSKDIIGSVLTGGDGEQFTVVGVVKDFVYNEIYSSPRPLIFFNSPESYESFSFGTLSLRLKANADVEAAVANLISTMKKYNPGYPVDYSFVDREFDKLFKTETLTANLATVFAVLAIFISCLGLFGLAAYTAERRTREMGIRKVLGAGAGRLMALLSREFLLLVGISCLIAFPIAWWSMRNWLQDFEYRVTIHWSVFLLAGLMAILIAVCTVSYQAVKTAMLDPVKSIRSE